MVKRYRKRPVVIEAMQFNRETWKELLKFTKRQACLLDTSKEPAICIIPTLEGQHIATEGDYIIKGVKGEFYPCKPDIFSQTYEEV